MRTKVLRHALLFALLSVGILAIFVAGGSVEEGESMSMADEMETRAVALLISLSCLKAGQWCSRKGLLPKEFCKDDIDERKED